MIKDFVVKAFPLVLAIGFVVCAVSVFIFGIVSMFASGGVTGFFSGLMVLVAGFIYLILCFGVIYLLVDIRDILKSQSETSHF